MPSNPPARLDPPPVFVVGAERSGSTLLRIMLDGHRDLAVIGQFEYAVDAIGSDGAFPSLDSFHDFLSLDRVFQLHDLALDETLAYPDLVASFLELDRDRKSASQAVGVIHRNFRHLPALFADARYIHLVRDGRDVSRSAMAMGWAADTWNGAGPWLEAERDWDVLVARLDPSRWIEVRYEDLVSDHEGTVARICAFVGVECRMDELLSYARETDYEVPDAGLARQWVQRATPAEIGLCEARIGDVLQARGYELSGHPIPTIDAVAESRLARRNRRARLRHRLGRFGLRLTAQEMAARRLHLDGLARRTRLEMNRVLNASLRRSWRDSDPEAPEGPGPISSPPARASS